MRKFVAIAGLALVLAACSEADAPADLEATEEVAASNPGDPGTYTRILDDGSINTTEIKADGTFISANGDESVSGTVSTTDGSTCFDAEGDESEASCWKNGAMRADGSFESTNDLGETVVIKYSAE
jgi:hypothetical protein